jgi:hypothetical protein
MGEETEWGFYEAVPVLAADFPGESHVEVVTRAKGALRELIARGHVEIFLQSSGEETPIATSEIARVVADDASWEPPEGQDGRPWHETPSPSFVVTEEGRKAYRGLSVKEQRRYFWQNSP